MKTLPIEVGSLSRRVPPRQRSAFRNDDEYLFRNPANAERLRRAHADAVAGRGGVVMTLDEIRALAGLGPE
jgi:hypothetical protein